MEEKLMFCLNSILFGIGLAMDAFSVSMANGLHEPRMKTERMCLIAGTFGVFQVLMPLLGWACVHTIAELFEGFHRLIPWIALLLLGYIGGKMLLEGLRGEGGGAGKPGKHFDGTCSLAPAALVLRSPGIRPCVPADLPSASSLQYLEIHRPEAGTGGLRSGFPSHGRRAADAVLRRL
jgi:hypothetical protein